MCPGGNLRFSPSQKNIGMMSLLFSEFANPIDEYQGGAEIGEGKRTLQVMAVDHLPPRNFPL